MEVEEVTVARDARLVIARRKEARPVIIITIITANSSNIRTITVLPIIIITIIRSSPLGTIEQTARNHYRLAGSYRWLYLLDPSCN